MFDGKPLPTDAEIDADVKKLVDANDPRAERYKETYLGGISLAHSWWTDAKLKGSSAEEVFKRILDGAIKRYKNVFGDPNAQTITKTKKDAA